MVSELLTSIGIRLSLLHGILVPWFFANQRLAA
jgi:hypothetical protein